MRCAGGRYTFFAHPEVALGNAFVRVKFNGHDKTCGGSRRGFYVGNSAASHGNKCIQLRRRHKHGFGNLSCSNKDAYVFRVEMSYVGSSLPENNGPTSVNIKDNGQVTCPSSGGSGGGGGGGGDSGDGATGAGGNNVLTAPELERID